MTESAPLLYKVILPRSKHKQDLFDSFCEHFLFLIKCTNNTSKFKTPYSFRGIASFDVDAISYYVSMFSKQHLKVWVFIKIRVNCLDISQAGAILEKNITKNFCLK